MNMNKSEFEELEKACTEVISTVLHACEAKLANNNDDVKGLSSAAMGKRAYPDILSSDQP